MVLATPAPAALDPAAAPVLAPDERRRAELRDFLISRRAQISPAEAGMPAGAGRRRTPGLRREEVAVLAGVGVSWYQWLEQGRDITVSAQVLDAVGRVLKLSEPERQHLYALAGLTPPPLRAAAMRTQDGCPALQRMIDAWWPNPGHIVDRYWNITATNAAAHLVLGLRAGGNCLVEFFEGEQFKRGYQVADQISRRLVAQYRAEMTNSPGDPGYHEVVNRLLRTSPYFAQLWDLHEVEAAGVNHKVYQHEQVGELRFETTQLRVPEWPDLTVVMHTPLAETDTRQRLERLLDEHERRHGLRVAA
ncbi:helix-turn-helix domain-containing protein [Actinospica durhamensis]|uniref:Helix-turn-helix domain-containing protein n=1 Tax=Actinospica durhamensis TaxID=1508375 RepID=A0A941INQ0_9ACTN|nr:helix-turn-helix transcriptional regulator [Actinospica durhamensis]MBR7832272.1 helix-turn-helix domain-containing protein [Actinospica durhamensis]